MNVLKDILLTSIKPYLRDIEITVFHNNKKCINEEIDVIIEYGDSYKAIKLSKLNERLKNGEIEIA